MQKGLIIGFILFIVSEVFAFLSVFWAFFHSSLSPAIEIGGCWPPQGITALDPFAIPLLNTFLLLSSGAFITWGHHALIQGDRKSAIIGTFLTIVLAVIFTALQYYEYSEAAFNISDSVFGTVFYASTGLHGLLQLVPTKLNKSSSLSPARSCNDQLFLGAGQGIKIRNIHYNHPLFCSVLNSTSPDPLNLQQRTTNTWLTLKVGSGKQIYIHKKFIEWLVGFTDAEGNFNISLRNFKNNSYNSLVLTFQIGLHIDDLETLKFIQKNLQCGKISISGNRCNFFVNDRVSLINIIIPVFNFMELNSSKYYQFLIFEKAVNLIKNKEHLTPKGKLEIIKLYLKNKHYDNYNMHNRTNIKITVNWLGGFIDGDATFSTAQKSPRLRFENHVRELPLFNNIAKFFKSGTVNITKSRKNRINSNPTVTLDYTNIQFLKNSVVPILSNKLNEFKILNSKKANDFNDWVMLVNIFYYGYHNLPEGIALINEITSRWNNFRLSTNNILKNPCSVNAASNSSAREEQSKLGKSTTVDLTEQFRLLLIKPSPYIIKEGIRYYRDSLNLVSDKNKIVVIDNSNNESIFSSISECSRILNLNRAKIKECLISGEIYKNYKFKFLQST